MDHRQTLEFLLNLGDKKRAVVFLKQLLKEMPEIMTWVSDLKKVENNDIYDEITYKAVQRFQLFHNLPRKDGVVDEITWYFIGQRINPTRLKIFEASYPALYKFIIGKTMNSSLLAPKGYASDRVLSDEECDVRFAEIFGEKTAVARVMIAKDMRNDVGRGMSGHSAESRNDFPLYIIFDGKRKKDYDRGGIIHIYTDENASQRKDIGLFAPQGWTGTPISYFSEGNSGLRFTYPTGLTISFVHVGTDNKDKIPSIPSKNSTDTNKFKSIHIGWIAGYGGVGSANYSHTHIIFYSNFAKEARVYPRDIFCGW